MFSASMPVFATVSSMAAVQTALSSSAFSSGCAFVVQQAAVYRGEMTMLHLPPRLMSIFWMHAFDEAGKHKKPAEGGHPENRKDTQEPPRTPRDGQRGYPEPRYAPPRSPFQKSYKPSHGF
jgi:hypothetical protein